MRKTTHEENLSNFISTKVEVPNEVLTVTEESETDVDCEQSSKVSKRHKKTANDLLNDMKKQTISFSPVNSSKDFKSRHVKFPIVIKTEWEQYKRDKEWLAKANPIAKGEEIKRTQNDLKLLEKRRHQRLMKEELLEKQYMD